MTTTKVLEQFREFVKDLGIPEYVENVSDEEIIAIALHRFTSYIEDNLDEIYADIHEGDENE